MADGTRLGRRAALDHAGQRLGDQIRRIRVEHLLRGSGRVVHFLALRVLHGGDDMQRRLVALVGDCRVPSGHVLQAQAVVAEYGERVGSIQRFVLDAGLVRGLRDFLGPQFGLQVHIHGVRGLLGRRIQVDVSEILAAVVAHGLRDAGEGAVGVAVEIGVEAHAGVDGGQQCERLHRGTDLIGGLGDVVQLFRQIIVTRIQCDDRSVLRIHRHRAELHAIRHDALHAVLRCADGREHQILLRFVDGGDDLVAAGLQILFVKSLGFQQFVLHHGQQIAVRSRHLVVLLHLHHLREGGFLLLLRGDVSVFAHDVEHTLETLLRLLGVHVGRPCAWRRNDAGEHGGLRKRQVLGVFVEVRLGRSLDAVGAASQINGVHIVAEHLALILLLRDLDGEERLPELAAVGDGFAEVIPFRVLLRDGRAALTASRGQVVVQRAGDADQVDALVGIE